VNAEDPTIAVASRKAAPRYRWLLFDADGTLFDYDRAERAALEQALTQIGLSFDPAYHLPTYRQINSALWHGVEKGEITPAVVKVCRFELLLKELQVAHSAAALSASYLECLANCSELIEDAEAVLGGLHKRYRIAILTNGLQVVQRGRLARSPIRHHVADIIISEEIGAAKPAREFFDKAFARLGQPSKHEVLMIGDGWGSDIQWRFSMALMLVGLTRLANLAHPIWPSQARSLPCATSPAGWDRLGLGSRSMPAGALQGIHRGYTGGLQEDYRG
jgi:2-haloacid dehalogenase